MRILSGGVVSDDAWQLLARDEPLPLAPAILPLVRWLEETREDGGKCHGLLLRADDPFEAAAIDFGACSLIAIEFETFTDGRGYSVAQTLRRSGFRGDLRAVGEVLRDQVFFLARCGFTSFALGPAADPDELIAAFDDFSLVYQPAADGRDFVARLRARARQAQGVDAGP